MVRQQGRPLYRHPYWLGARLYLLSVMESIDNILPLVNTIGIILGALFLLFNKTVTQKRETVDHLEEKTVTTLQANITALELRLKLAEDELIKSRDNHEQSMREIARLTGENNTMKTLLEGRDTVTKDFYESSMANMKLMESAVTEFRAFLIRFDAHAAINERFITSADGFRKDVRVLADIAEIPRLNRRRK